MIRKLLTLTLSLAFLFCVQASAQTADEIIKKNIDAYGGLEKLKTVKTMRASGKATPQGLEIPIILQQKRPGMMRMDATFQGKTQTEAYDGSTGWKIDPFQGNPIQKKLPAMSSRTSRSNLISTDHWSITNRRVIPSS